MLTLLIPFIALLAGAQAGERFDKPAIVDFIGNDGNHRYAFAEGSSADSNEIVPVDKDGPNVVGRISVFEAQKESVFFWIDASDARHKCVVGFEQEPIAKSFSYNLDTRVQDQELQNGDSSAQDLDSLRVECEGGILQGPAPVTSTPPPSDSSSSFEQELTVKFFARPENVTNTEPVWFLDTTLPADYGNESDKPTNGIKPKTLEDGSIGIGQMTLTHPSTRCFGYQRKFQDPNIVNIDDCIFEVKKDLHVPEIHYWADTKTALLIKNGEVVMDPKEEKIEDIVSISCRDKDGNKV